MRKKEKNIEEKLKTYTYKITHISAVTCPRVPDMVSNNSQDTTILPSDSKCKYSNFNINEF